MRELTTWLSGPADPDSFPYAAVLAEFQRTGKHFVDKEILALLDHARTHVGPASGPPSLLHRFLDVTLDKWDGRYDYRSYLALSVLGLPCDAADPLPAEPAAARHDRLFVQLIADALGFELAVQAGATDLLPEQRPAPELVTKRYRLGVRAAAPALARLGRNAPHGPTPAAKADALRTAALADQSPTERSELALSMLPVYLSHDEYLFIRVLQAYECTFAALTDDLRAAIDALTDGPVRAAADRLAAARDRLAAAAPLFSLLACMQRESFRTFRAYTEGASAIQSRSYKLMESLCRTPDESRLASAAYRAVPEVRDRVRAGQPSIEAAYRAAERAGRLAGPDGALVRRRMTEFAAAVLQWRQTHYRLAVRMLGTAPGTGYTEGTPYLAAVRAIPVFTVTDEPTSAADETGGRCE